MSVLIYELLSWILFRLRYPKVKHFRNVKGYYSQAGQDNIIYNHFFYRKNNGFFVNIGANDPIIINNTYYFENLGWTGIAYDPQIDLAKKWKKSRTCNFFPLALSNDIKFVQFHKVKDEVGWENMLSYIEYTSKEKSTYSSSTSNIKTSTLSIEFEKFSIDTIDFLSVDVEGHELEIIKGIDFNRVKINVILIENNPSSNRIFGKQNIRNFLSSKGFIFYGRIHALDDIFVSREYKAIKK